MKKIVAMILVLMLVLPAGVASANKIKPDPNIDVLLYGEKLFFDIDPIQTQGTTFVQFTTIFKALGLQYQWFGDTKEVHAYSENVDLWLTLNDPIAVLNGELIELPIAPFSYEGRTLVPLRFVSQATGLQVDWDGANKLIEIYSKTGSPDNSSNESAGSVTDFIGYAEGANQEVVIKFMDIAEPTSVDEFDVVYDYVDLFGYDTQLYYSFLDDELTSAYHYYGRYGENNSDILEVYLDFVDQLTNHYGSPVVFDLVTAYQEGVETEVVEMDMTDAEILKALKAGEIEMITEWELADGAINVYLYKQDDGVLTIQVGAYYY